MTERPELSRFPVNYPFADPDIYANRAETVAFCWRSIVRQKVANQWFTVQTITCEPLDASRIGVGSAYESGAGLEALQGRDVLGGAT